MATAKSSNKAGPRLRLARQSDRDHAAELAQWYRDRHVLETVAMPDGSIERVVVDGDYLATELVLFAQYGTWTTPPTQLAAIRRKFLRELYDMARKQGKSKAEAFAMLTQVNGEQTVRDALYRRSKRPRRKA